MYLYEIVNTVDSKKYIGITNDIKRRWKEHKSELRYDKYCNRHLQSAWNLYKENNFKFEIINKFNNLEDLNKAEIEYIDKYDLKNPTKGYNLADGGNGFEHTEEAKLRIIEAQLIPVVRMNIKTKEIFNYKSIKDTEKDGFSPKAIGSTCILRNLTYKKNVWMYKSEYDRNPEELVRRANTFTNVKARPSLYRAVIGKNIKTGKIVRFESSYHSKALGFTHQIVYKCCSNKVKVHKDFVWVYEEDVKLLDLRIKTATSSNINLKNIFKFSLSGEFIEEIDRSEYNRFEIRGMQSIASGIKVSYKNSLYSYSMDINKQLANYKKSFKGFVKYGINGEIMTEYSNIKELKKDNPNIKDIANIYRCCSGERKTAHGFKWSFTGGGLLQ